MSHDIPYAFDAILEADERLQDATLYLHLERDLGDRLSPVSALHDVPDHTWGRDWHGTIPARREMARAAYENPFVLSSLGNALIATGTVAIEAARTIADTFGSGLILRNIKDPVTRIRHTRPGEDILSHLRSIGVAEEDQVLVQPNFELRHLRRFMVVAGSITCESPMFFKHEIANIEGECFTDLQVDESGQGFISRPDAWRHMQYDAAQALLAVYPMVCGAIDVGFVMRDGKPLRARIENVTAAPPGGVFAYMADMARLAERIIEHADALLPCAEVPAEP